MTSMRTTPEQRAIWARAAAHRRSTYDEGCLGDAVSDIETLLADIRLALHILEDAPKSGRTQAMNILLTALEKAVEGK
jgi:hypothetical protein